jgi:hypothetical protein
VCRGSQSPGICPKITPAVLYGNGSLMRSQQELKVSSQEEAARLSDRCCSCIDDMQTPFLFDV